jgi:uncharacterized membrane protein YdjX (TVP38/TMEM64 family)
VLEREQPAGVRAAITSPRRGLLVLGAWALLFAAVQLYAWYEMLTSRELLEQLLAFCALNPLGPLLFIGVAALSPLLLVPAALLGSIAGICFGPLLGVIYTLIGCNLSALLTYSLGRASGRAEGRIARLCARYGLRLRERPLLSVVLLRLSFLPYDPVNYLIGILRVRLWPFLLGNTLGSLPGVVVIVLAGSAVGGLGLSMPQLSPLALLGALGLLVAILVVAAALRHRRRRPTGATINKRR